MYTPLPLHLKARMDRGNNAADKPATSQSASEVELDLNFVFNCPNALDKFS